MFRSPRSIYLAFAVSVLMTRKVGTRSMAIALLVFLSATPAVAQATVEYGHVATGASTSLTGLSNKINSSVSQSKKPASVPVPAKQPGVATGAENNPDNANRRAFEQAAGQNAATLSLKSTPAKAVVRIDGKPVGRTPLLISLAPGVYKVEMDGPRMEFGKQQINLGPRENREIELPLSVPPRYPTHMQLQ